MQITLSRYEPSEDGSQVTVGFDAVLADGSMRHAVTTVYPARLPDRRRSTIIAAADDDVRPGLAVEDARATERAADAAPDWFDTIDPTAIVGE